MKPGLCAECERHGASVPVESCHEAGTCADLVDAWEAGRRTGRDRATAGGGLLCLGVIAVMREMARRAYALGQYDEAEGSCDPGCAANDVRHTIAWDMGWDLGDDGSVP